MQRVILLIAGLCFVAGFSCCNEKPASKGTQKEVSRTNERVLLLPVVQNGKYGFINKTGEIVIPPQFDYAKGFSEGLAPVNVGGTLLLLKVGNPLYDSRPNKYVSGGKWGYIDKQGNMVIQPQFDDAGGFKDGVASVNIGATGTSSKLSGIPQGGKWGAIDRTGKIVIPVRYNWMLMFINGLAPFNIEGKQGWNGFITGGKWGCVDKTGKIVIEPKFDIFFYFSDGLASVSVDGHYVSTTLPGFEKPADFPIGGKFGFIDTSGKYVIKPSYQAAFNFSEGLAAVKLEGKYGYIDKAGTFVIPPRYNQADRFSEGLAFARNKDNNGFINKKGEFVIQLVQMKGSSTEENGEYVFKPGKRQISSHFVDGLAIVTEFDEKEIRCGVIDKKGTFVIPLDSRSLGFCGKEIFYVITEGGKKGYMDRAGNYIWKPTE